MTGPTTPSFPPPREQSARVVIKPACPRMSPGKHRLRLRSHSSKGKGGEGRRGRSEVLWRPQESGPDWTGLARPQAWKGEQTTHPGRISPPHTRIKGLEVLSTCPSCLTNGFILPLPTSSLPNWTQLRMGSLTPHSFPHSPKHCNTLKMAWSAHPVQALPSSQCRKFPSHPAWFGAGKFPDEDGWFQDHVARSSSAL